MHFDKFAADKGGTDGVSDFAELDMEFSDDLRTMDDAPFESFIGDTRREKRRFDRISDNREPMFELSTGRFRAPDGEFEPGSPPPDYDSGADRFRAETGRFKDRSADLFDEPEEVRRGSLEPRG